MSSAAPPPSPFGAEKGGNGGGGSVWSRARFVTLLLLSVVGLVFVMVMKEDTILWKALDMNMKASGGVVIKDTSSSMGTVTSTQRERELEQENAQLKAQLKKLMEEAKEGPTEARTQSTVLPRSLPPRNVTVHSMCRCSGGNLAMPQERPDISLTSVGITQEASLAVGPASKIFQMNPRDCQCLPGQGVPTGDGYLANIEQQFCGEPEDSGMKWGAMPDFGVEQQLPVFLGVLSYKSPLSLNATLTQWTEQFFTPQHVGLAGSFVQLNARSKIDDEVVKRHQPVFNFTATGTAEENFHPGKTIARFCRQAEKHPKGHPNGENILIFLEKDWHLSGNGHGIKRMVGAVNTLSQRGVPYVRLTKRVNKGQGNWWPCDAEGIKFECTTSHQHRYTNLPAMIRCDWFLRYLEPFALLEDTIMHGCRRGFRQSRYFDWEEAMQDGRIAWTEAQWVVASFNGAGPRWVHHEVDQRRKT